MNKGEEHAQETDRDHRLCFDARIIQQSLGQTIHSLGKPISAKSHECHCLFFPRFKPGRRTSWNCQSKAERYFTVEFERTIGFKEMAMRTDLNRAVTDIRHGEFNRLPAVQRDDVTFAGDNFAGDHWG